MEKSTLLTDGSRAHFNVRNVEKMEKASKKMIFLVEFLLTMVEVW